MMKLLFCRLFISIAATRSCVDSIRNGDFIFITEAPFFAALVSEKNWWYCGAAIISEEWIITAAHCINADDRGSQLIYYGGNNFMNLTQDIHFVEKHFVHGDWNDDYDMNHDIALIKLKQPIQFNEYQQPIKLRPNSPQNGDTVTVYGIGDQGHGRQASPVLKKTDLQYVDDESTYIFLSPTLLQHAFLVGSNDSDGCSGDSGGPAVIDGKLAGLVSSGPRCVTLGNKFRLPPGIYTRVNYFYNWIIKITGLDL